MSTITLAVERTPKATKPKPKDDDEAGFLAGLSDGWDALKTFLVGALDRRRRAAAVAGADAGAGDPGLAAAPAAAPARARAAATP